MKLVYAITLLFACINSLEAKAPTRMVPGHYIGERALAFSLPDDQGITIHKLNILVKKFFSIFLTKLKTMTTHHIGVMLLIIFFKYVI